MTTRPARLALLAALFAATCLAPHVARLRHPSLYVDDVVRVAQLRTMAPRELLFAPFNEHMAPCFQGVSWVAWRLAGSRLTNAPLAFTLASLLPFLLGLGALGGLVRRESGSTTAALAAVAVVSLSPVAVETTWWYSASSFTWSACATLAVLWCAGRARLARRPWPCWLGAALAAALAPAFSAIGLLAGPAGAVRALVREDRRRDGLGAAFPILGTLIYLAVCSQFRYRAVLSQSIGRHHELPAGLLAAARAPVEVLLPGLLGLKATWPIGVSLVLTVLALIALLAGTWRGPRRPLVLAGLVLIVGGYVLIYPFRTADGVERIIRIQRYHLFPQLGLILVLAALGGPRLRRLDARPVARLVAAATFALALWAIHRETLDHRAMTYRFPDQGQTLAALERVEAIGRERGITRDQALATFGPIRPRWFPVRGHHALMMLGTTVAAPRLAGASARSTLLSALSSAERAALCGGMDATPHLRPASPADGRAVGVGRLVKAFQARAAGPNGQYLALAGPAFLEYEFTSLNSEFCESEAEPHVLLVPAAAPGGEVEVWWAGASGRWSESRSVRWRTDPSRLALLLDHLPHWQAAEARRLRVVFPDAGPFFAGAPTLLR